MFEEEQDNLDFQSYPEYDEELDFKNTKPCPHCRKLIPSNAISCLYCGESVSLAKKPQWIIWLIVFVLLCFLLLVLF
ncbi:MAG: hypothetical protein JW734_09900 [Candidatus Omnitrophica bacterium]|nr:hypothetical protein [Candidatus Omnitrophota bacterium]